MRAALRGIRGDRLLLAANAVCAAVSAASCVAAAIKPDLALPGSESSGPAVGFYVSAYVVRQLPLSAAVIALVAREGRVPGSGGRRRQLASLLAVSGAAQAGDALIGHAHGNPGMTIGASVCASLHLVTALRLARSAMPAAAVN